MEQDVLKWLEIGEIVAPQGLKGELRVKTITDFPERLIEPGPRWLKRLQSPHPEMVELLSGYQIPGKNVYVVKLAEVKDRLTAEQLRGCKLLVSQNDLPELETDEYHVSELIDVPVYDHLSQVLLGRISAILYAGNDLLEVTLNNEKKVLIPFVKEIVPLVDIENRRIEVNPPDGLLELNQ